jgi:hypothetical protein
MGFYIRKGFNFGPLRLNLSRSGLGASFGVKGARIGVGPRGTYVHMGRGGLYYRQTLHLGQQSPVAVPPQIQPSLPRQPISDGLQEISSSDAVGMLDSSATELLQELNRVERRKDLFPFIIFAGALLLIHLLLLNLDWWLYALYLPAAIGLAILARDNDVTNGTVMLNYLFEGDSVQVFAALGSAFAKLASCRGFWHIDAAGATADWKRNAGANSLERRTGTSPRVSRPPKVQCNIEVPTLGWGRRSLYFFPDRLLVYDSSGVGAVSYAELNAQVGQSRFIEDGIVPSDAQQVGTTWKFVRRDGGPDRRFNNNRQLPVLIYGQMSLTSASGLNELFQYSAPSSGGVFAGAVTQFRAANPTAAYNSSQGSDALPSKSKGRTFRTLLLLSLGLMTALFLFLPWPSLGLDTDGPAQTQQEPVATQEQARNDATENLNQQFVSNRINAAATSANDVLTVQMTKEGPKSARRDGVEPFVKDTFFERVLHPDTESSLCALGFRMLSVTRKDGSPNVVALDCGASP